MADGADWRSDPTRLPPSVSDRQRAIFRRVPGVEAEDSFPRTAVAVVSGDGSTIGVSTETLLLELLYEIRALRLGLVLTGAAADLEDKAEGLIT